MKSKIKILTILTFVICFSFLTFKAAFAYPSFDIGPTKSTTAEVKVKAGSDWQNVIYFVAQASSTDDYIKQVQFTVNWIAGTFGGTEISQIALYKSTDSTMDTSGDTLVASKNSASINYGALTTFTWSGTTTENMFSATGTDYWFYLVLKTDASVWSDNGAGDDDQITISMAAADVVLRDVAGSGDVNSTSTPTTDAFTADVTAPTLPAANIDAKNSVQPNTVTVEMSEVITTSTAETAGNWTVTNNGATITYSIASASLGGDGKTVTLTLAALDPDVATTFITNAEIDNHIKVIPSTSIVDKAGNTYGGSTITESGGSPTKDTTAPTLAAANIVVDNSVQPNTITLTFSEKLNTTTAQTATNWTVTNNAGDITYSIASASLSNTIVTLTLATVNPSNATTFITNADVDAHIKVTPSANITDVAGKTYAAGEITEAAAVPTKDSSAPTLAADAIVVNNNVQPNTITLTFNEKLNTTTANDLTHWTVTNNAGDITYSIATTSLSNAIVTLTLSAVTATDSASFITNADADAHIKVTPSAHITDVAGITYAAGEITEAGATHTKDETAPTIPVGNIDVDNSVQPNTITLEASEKLNTTTAETAANWTVTSNSGDVTYSINSVSLGTDSKTVTLTLAAVNPNSATTFVTASQIAAHIKVVFSGSSVTDVAGTAFADETVTESGGSHTEDSTAPTLAAANIVINNSVQPNTITLTFSEKLNTTTAEDATHYTIINNAGDITYSIASASLSNTIVTLTLSAVSSADPTTFITNADVDAHIKVTPSTHLTDVSGKAYEAGQVTEAAAVHTKDSTAPTLAAANIVVDNSVQPNTITLTFSEKLNTTTAETLTNWTVTNNAGDITYSIASASLSNTIVTLTLATVNPSNATTFITNADVDAHIKVTPSANITDVAGKTYAAGEITEAAAVPTKDSSAPTLAADAIVVNNNVQPNTITLTFNEKLNTTTANDLTHWTVTNNAGDITYSIATTSLSNAIVTLTLSAVNPSNSTTFITNAAIDDHIKVTPSAHITDVAGITYAAGEITEAGATHTKDETSPTVVDDWTLSINAGTMTINFSEVMDSSQNVDETKITVQENADTDTASQIRTLTDSTSAWADNNTLTVTLSTEDLAAIKLDTGLGVSTSTSYLEIIASSNMKDVAGNNVSLTNVTDGACIYATTFTGDTTGPALSYWTLNINTGHLVMTFNEPVNTTTLTTTGITVQDAATKTWQSLTLTGGTTGSSNGTSVDIALSAADLNSIKAKSLLAKAQGSSYLVITSSVIDDMASNAVTAITDGSGVNATSYVADATSPSISSQYPTDGSTNIAVDVDPYVTFSEAMDPLTITDSTVLLKVYDTDASVSSVVSLQDGNTKAVISPDANLSPGGHYYISVTAGAKDLEANAVAAYNTKASQEFTVISSSTVISSVAISNIAMTTASTTWTTDSSSTSNTVEYGLTSALGSTLAAATGDTVKSHIANLTSLTADRLYYYRVKSTAGGVDTYSDIYTFTTAAATTGITVESISMVKYYATADNTYANGWKWKISITVHNTAETSLKMKFTDWTSGTNTIAISASTATTTRIGLTNEESSASTSTVEAATYGVGNAYTDQATALTLVDEDTSKGGIQETVYLYVKIPTGTAGGSYSTTYGIYTY
ncbi:MAG: Ig-like domain-containing protein [Candidatus Pacebacteria bacterium]|nr:Ig-like domain-containing protein [Candidatus Paceibacterota bacterium]